MSKSFNSDEMYNDEIYNCANCKMSSLISSPDGQVLYCYATKKYIDVDRSVCLFDNLCTDGELISREEVLNLLKPLMMDANPFRRSMATALIKAINKMPSAVSVNDIYELPDGWLDPCGKIYLSSEYDLSDIVTELHYEDECDSDGRPLSDDDILYNHGWVSIRFYRNKKFKKVWRICWNRWENPCHRLTEQQKAFLKPYFERELVNPSDRRDWEEEQ